MTRETVWTSEDGRARVILVMDESPEAPYDDGGSPILRVSSDCWGRFRAEQITDVTSYRLPDDIAAACEHYGPQGGDRFARYLRIWHGVTVIDSYGINNTRAVDDNFLTFDPTDWRDQVGAAAGSISLDEWRAYCEGDVWTWARQELTTWTAPDGRTRETWETVDACGGYYGQQWATEAALEEVSA